MRTISEYRGNLINHLEGLYRPQEQALAVEFVEALGFEAVPIPLSETYTLTSVHPNSADLDATNNVMFLTEMSGVFLEVDNALQKKIASDPELNDAVKAYREKASGRPSGIPHFGVRYPSAEALDPVVHRLRNGLSPALRDRVTVTEMPPFKPIPGFPDIKQVFVYTDVIMTGPSAYGQLIELQIVRD